LIRIFLERKSNKDPSLFVIRESYTYTHTKKGLFENFWSLHKKNKSDSAAREEDKG
jgi:hypothetical protein